MVKNSIHETDKKKVVVLGGGFAGSLAAKKLENDFEVTLVDSKEYFEFTPSILRTIIDPKHIKKIQVLHEHYLHKANVIRECAMEITKKEVVLNNKQRVPFDYIVLCTGSSYNLPIKEKEVVTATRAKHLREQHERLCKAEHVVLVGGGMVGVELAAEIGEHYPGKHVTLIHSREELMPRNHAKTRKYAHKFLTKKGINLVYGERLIEKKGKVCVTDKGREIPADMIFLCTGIKPYSAYMKKNFKKSLDKRGYIKVNNHLQVEGLSHVFAAGDLTDVKVEKTAQNAEHQAEVVVENILAKKNGKELATYSTQATPIIISLGKYNGILEKGNFVMTGLIPGLIKGFLEWIEMKKH
jgi:apoptosis-inducing factor 2